MPIKEMFSSVSFTVATLPIKQVDLDLRRLSFLSRHKGRDMQALEFKVTRNSCCTDADAEPSDQTRRRVWQS